jgi:hypothetical protein
MNFKTTLLLILLVVLGGLAWGVYAWVQPGVPASETLTVLRDQLTPEQITRIEVKRAEHPVLLEKVAGQWTLPGRWPVRKPEVKQLLDTLTNLRSRFEPIALGNSAKLGQFGLNHPLLVKVKAGGKEYQLAFGEEAGESNRFSRATFLRLDDKDQVVRLAPGLLAILDRPQEHYMQRQLFPAERVAVEKKAELAPKVNEVDARNLSFKGPASDYTLAKQADRWELTKPVPDRPDPEQLKKILTGVPDIWAERFVDSKGKDLAEFGLKTPQQKLRVTRPKGPTITLLVGKSSRFEVRHVKKTIPSPSPLMPPKSFDIPVKVEFFFAKLQDNDQVFEIKSDHLKDLDVPLADLRDPQLAHFKADDVQRLEVDEGGRQLVFVKDKDTWRMEKPRAVEAESFKVTELLDKLAALQARGGDILDKADPKTYGLDHPADVKLKLEEGKDKKAREITFRIGKDDAEKKKLYVQVAGQERVNAVDDDLAKLVKRPALAYRARRVLDVPQTDMARIEVHKDKSSFTLEQAKGIWQLTAPVHAKLDPFKTGQLAGELSHLDAEEFINDNPKTEDLDKVYGLAKPGLTLKIVLKDAKKTAPEVLVGKQRAGKQDYYAKLASDPAVFVLRKDTFETLDRDSLAYRPLELWRLPASDVAQVRVSGAHPEYTLKHEGAAWKISGPFEANASPEQVQPMTEELAAPKAERYVANAAKDLAPYGLDRPYLRVAVKAAGMKAGGKDKEEGKEHVLLIGKQTEKGAKSRFARLGDGEAVFVVGDKMVSAADHAALDLLDRRLLALDTAAIQRLHGKGQTSYTLERDKAGWRVVDSPAPPFPADKEAVDDTLRTWSLLRAQRFAAYGGKLDLAAYGLDKPGVVLTITTKGAEEKGKSAKPVQHTLALGKVVKAGQGERYGRLDDGPGIAVLDARTAENVGRSYLDFVKHTALQLDVDQISGLARKGSGGDLELVKRGEDWRIAKPAEQPADRPTVDLLLEQLSELRAKRVAAYPVKDVQPFGLGKPAAVLTVRLGSDKKGKPVEHTIELGNLADKGKGGDRFARVDRSDAVLVLPATLSEQLLAVPLQFRDRNLVKVPVPTRAVLERGPRKAFFVEEDGDWKMTQPLAAEAVSAELQAFAKSVSRLRADKLIAEKPADLKPYGLDAPRVRWRFSADDKKELGLLLGRFEKGGKRAYAKLEKGDLVFLLDERLTGQALAEYRDRKVWAPLDAVQITKLRFGFPQAGLVLQKISDGWQVSGRPELKITEDAVRDTLDALARLQADHYVADKGGDRKLFGLDPPALALEIYTPGGPRTLLIGRKEGTSGGYYASVAGAKDAPIFVLSEAEGRKIVRPLQAFVIGKK